MTTSTTEKKHPSHIAIVAWENAGPDFAKGKYSREHTWTFDGGAVVAASPAPSVVPAPWSSEQAVDPEEAFVASIASCHMLTFLWVASRAGFVVERYRDRAEGEMHKNESGVPWVARVALHPVIHWGGEKQPTDAEIQKLHHDSHKYCFIANSVKSEIVVEA